CYLSSETFPPVMTYSALFSAEDESASGYRELTAKDFASWSDEQACDFAHGDYSLNHIKDSVWITFAGYDEQSGVGEVQITETYYKTVDGVEKNSTPSVSTIPISRNCKKNSDGSYSTSYKLRTMDDGVVKLEIALLDGCGNESNEKFSYYVIRDCIMDDAYLRFSEISWNDLHPKVSDASGDTVTLTLDGDSLEVFYGSYSAPFKCYVFYGYSQDSVNIPVEVKEGVFSFINEKPDLITYVKIRGEDEVGNFHEILRAIPPRPDFDINCCETKVESGKRRFSIKPYNYNQLKDMPLKMGVLASFGSQYRVVDLTDGTERDYTDNDFNLTAGHDYEIYPYSYFFFWDGYWCSSASVGKYLSLKVESNPSESSSCREFKVVDTAPTMNSIGSDARPSPIEFVSQIESGSGFDRITVTNANKFSSDYNWYLIFKDSESKLSSFALSGEQEIYLKTPGKYRVYVKAVNKSDGTVYVSNTPENIKYNGLLNPIFNLKDDATPPTMIFYNIFESIHGDSAAYYFKPPEDNKEIYSKDGLGELTYYFIPNPGSSVTYRSYTLEELSAYEGKTITYDLNADKILIPYLGLDEGCYTICVVAKDKSGNKMVKSLAAFNRMTEKPVSFYAEKNSGDSLWYIMGDCESVDVAKNLEIASFGLKTSSSEELYWDVDCGLGRFSQKGYWEGNKWVDTNKRQNSVTQSKVNGKWYKIIPFYKDTDSLLTATSGFTGTEYIYPDYYIYKGTSSEIKCIIKNMVQGTNGVQVYCDAPTLVHTLYSTVKISDGSEDEDIRLWENKGMEVSIKTASQTFTYDRSNYQRVPKGCWYTTIAHFADGSKTMTEPSLKR
ncbi:MAG: hypothetical protein VZR56_09665, partial [Treponema sp.]|nr:hypothetical protein [Treponema sp.]